MIGSDASDIADMLEWLDERVTRLESTTPGEGSLNKLRSTSDETVADDSVSATQAASTDGVVIGQSRWGYDTW